MKKNTQSSQKKESHHKFGFSMIELSMVILIIGVLIGGILASQKIIAKFRITTAQTLTISSPVNGIPDSTIWLESSLDKSFKENEASDTNKISAWYDIRENVNKNNAIQNTTANAPTYSNTINYIHAVKFDGTNGYLTIPDASFLNNSSYTIFVLEKRESNKSDNYFIGDSSLNSGASSNQNLTLGYSADGTIKHSQSSDNAYTSSISTYAASSDKPRIFAFVHDKTAGKKTYINGLLAAQSTNTDNLTGISSLTIGKSYQGQIGELIMFARALNQEERQSVEDYLGKKWSSTILRNVGNSALGASCVGGTVGTAGCQKTCTVPATTGITTTSVADGSGTLTCNSSNHFKTSPNLPYTCSNGVFAFTGATTSCSCQDNYSLSGTTCVSAALACSGGTESTISVSGTSYRLHVFTSSGNLVCTGEGNAQILVVAGGGAGGGGRGAGGGAGGMIYNSSYALSAGTYAASVGGGGVGVTNVNGGNGGNSVFGSITATGGGGGGGGGGGSQCGRIGSNGGSGGGGGRTNSASGCLGPISGGTGISGQGYNGGKSSLNYYGAGGGGGADTAGSDGTNSSGGNGGAGIIDPMGGTSYYGGGGGGVKGDATNNGSGGIGGGGTGNTSAGTTNTGGGGGGNDGVGKNGGSGIIIVRYTN